MNIVLAIIELLYSISALAKDPHGPVINRVVAMHLRQRETEWSSNTVALTWLAVIIGIFVIFIGIIALRYCEPVKRSKLLVIFAMINLAMMVTSTIIFVSFFSVLGCIIAVLFLVGAFKNYKQYLKIKI